MRHSFTGWSLVMELIGNWSCGRSNIRTFTGWDGQRNTECILEEEIYRGYTGLTYQAECGHRMGWWLLELCAVGSAVGCCGENWLCVMSVLQLPVFHRRDKINQQFKCLRNSTLSFFRCVCRSLCPHGKTGLQRDEFSCNLVYIYIYIYMKTFR